MFAEDRIANTLIHHPKFKTYVDGFREFTIPQ
jgi:hypothetical protein